MRKLVAAALSAMLAVASVVPIYAQETRQTTITVSIDPEYTVTIPASTSIASGVTESSIGTVALEGARLEPDKSVQVSVDASGKLKNSRDSTKTIPYKLMNGNSEFKSASYSASGNNTPLTLSIRIKQYGKTASRNTYTCLKNLITAVFTILNLRTCNCSV